MQGGGGEAQRGREEGPTGSAVPVTPKLTRCRPGDWRHHRQRKAGGIWTHVTHVPSYPNPRPQALDTALPSSVATFTR